MNQLTHHDDFIEKPVQSVLAEGLQAIRNIGHGIEIYPLYEYLLQSIFLKMTGFQEQKLKLIHWTIATYDNEEKGLWEYQQQYAKKGYSAYDEKNQLLKIICEKKLNQYGIFSDGNYSYYRSCVSIYYENYKNERRKISNEISGMLNDDSCLDAKKKDELFAIIESFDQKVWNFKKSIVKKDITRIKEKMIGGFPSEKRECFKKKMQCLDKVVDEYFKELDTFDNFEREEFLRRVIQDYNNFIGKSKHLEMFGRCLYMQNVTDELIGKELDRSEICSLSGLKKCHNFLYDHRNRCAHNTLSYQKNLPTLEVLADEDYQKFDNYYIRFLILILIDEIFMFFFKKYKEIILSEMYI